MKLQRHCDIHMLSKQLEDVAGGEGRQAVENNTMQELAGKRMELLRVQAAKCRSR